MILSIKDMEVLYDETDAELVAKYKWHIGDTGYAVWRGVEDGKKKTIRLHRLIANCPTDKIVDHINHNKLDNRRSNLRVCTQSDNMRNKTDQGKGYWYQKQNKNWVVEVYGIHRGTFDTEQEADAFAKLVRADKADFKPKVEPTHCKYGHSLSDAYLIKGEKRCKPCQKLRSQQYYKRKMEKKI